MKIAAEYRKITCWKEEEYATRKYENKAIKMYNSTRKHTKKKIPTCLHDQWLMEKIPKRQKWLIEKILRNEKEDT